MNILVTICARAGSKGVKNKNVKIFNDRPLVEYTLDAYKAFIKGLDAEVELAVNTDSELLVEQIGMTDVQFTHIKRKEELAGDTVGKVAVIKDTVYEMEKKNGKSYDYIIDLDLTSPLRRKSDISGVFAKLMKRTDADVAFSVVPARRLPFFNMVKENEDGICSLVIESNYLTRQEAPKCYDMNASIYAYRRDFLMREDVIKVLDGRAVFYEMEDTGIIDIDSEEDFELMQMIEKFWKGRQA